MKALYIPGPCQRPGCCEDESIKFRIESELFEADPERGVEAGYRLYGLGCCGGALKSTVDRLKAITPDQYVDEWC